MAVQLAHLFRSNPYPLRLRRLTWTKIEREGVKSGRTDAHKPGKLGLSCIACKCGDAGTGDLGVLPTRETSHIDDAG